MKVLVQHLTWMLSNGEIYWETKFSELVLKTIEKLIPRLTKIMCINHSANTEGFKNLLAFRPIPADKHPGLR